MDNLPAVSQAGYDITKRLGVALYPPVHWMLNRSSADALAASACSPRRMLLSYIVLCAFFHQRLNPLRMHCALRLPHGAHAPFALALAPAPSSFSSIRHTRALLHHADGRIPASFQYADGHANEAQLGMRVLMVHASLPPLSPRCLRRGVLAVEQAQDALFLVCEWEGSGTRSRPELSCSRYLPLAAPTHLVRLSTEVDGDADADADADLMKTAKRAAGDGNADGNEWLRVDGDGGRVRVRIHPSPTLTVERRLRLWFGAPAFTFTLALPDALTSSCAGIEKSGCPREHIFSLTVVLSIPPLLNTYAYTTDFDVEAGVYVCVWSAPHRRTPARHRAIETGCPCVSAPASLSSSYVDTDTEGARSADLGILLGLNAYSRAAGGGDGEMRVRALAPISPSFSSNSVGSLLSAQSDVYPASHPPSTYVRTAIAPNETST
ncbi:hypothetical protein B0H13DRAFT_2400821 [Mycena leptocephala]|nr:hypothetical protein B0H13DRAFT_2400821 [Mycena leptocephala]